MIQFYHWIYMGGYADYVWSAYAVVASVLVVNVVVARSRYLKIQDQLEHQLKENA